MVAHGNEGIAYIHMLTTVSLLVMLRVRSKEVKKRTLQRIPFSLGPGLEIGVGV